MTFRELVSLYDMLHLSQRSRENRDSAVCVLVPVVAFAGDSEAEAMDLAWSDRYVAWRVGQPTRFGSASIYTAYSELSRARAVLAWGARRRHVLRNGLVDLEMMKKPATPKPILSPEQVERMLNAPMQTEEQRRILRAGILSQYTSGCRISEIRAAKDSWLHERVPVIVDGKAFYASLLRIPPLDNKGRSKERIIVMHDSAVEAVRAVGSANGWLVPRKKTGKPWSYAGYRELFIEAGFLSGVSQELGRRVWTHLLRHSFGSRALLKGVPIQVVRDMLGHSSIQVTNTYAHAAMTDLVRGSLRVCDDFSPTLDRQLPLLSKFC